MAHWYVARGQARLIRFSQLLHLSGEGGWYYSGRMVFNGSALCSPRLVTAHGAGDWCAAVTVHRIMVHHRHIIGQPTTGKTSLLRELLSHERAPGICVIDTRGDLDIPHDYLFEPTVTRWNPLAEPINRDLAPTFFAQTIKEAFGYDDTTTPVMSMYLSFVAAALIENRYNLTDAPRLLTDPEFRRGLHYGKPLVRQFWDSFEELPDRDQRGEVASTLNKFLGLLLDGRAERMFSVNRGGVSLERMAAKTMLVRLPVADYGTDTVTLIGSLLLAYLAKLIQTPYAIYVEDAHLFAKGTMTSILNSSNQMSLTLSHQYMDQLKSGPSDTKLLSAVMGNCTERFVFKVSQQDANYLSQFIPPMSSKARLDELAYYTYRSFPYDRMTPDRITVPLEKKYESIN